MPTWTTLANLSADQLVTETHMDAIRENIEWLGQLQAAGVAFSLLNAISVARLAVGSYVGNGVDNRWITGIGFTPKFVILQRAATSVAVYRLSSMPADNSARFGSAGLVANLIQAENSDGFQVGSNADVNINTETFYYLCGG